MPHATRPSLFRNLSSYTAKDKPRLYIALYPRGGNDASSKAQCDSCHWAIVVASGTSSRTKMATRYHLFHVPTPHDEHLFCYEETTSDESPHMQDSTLVYVTIAKVLDQPQLSKVLRSIRPSEQDREHYTCFHWVRHAFMALHEEPGCLKSYFSAEDWAEIEKYVREYHKDKRRQGRFAESGAAYRRSDSIPTYNAWERRETTS